MEVELTRNNADPLMLPTFQDRRPAPQVAIAPLYDAFLEHGRLLLLRLLDRLGSRGVINTARHHSTAQPGSTQKRGATEPTTTHAQR